MERNEFIRGPKWRTRATSTQRGRAALLTFAGIAITGGVILGAVMWLLAWLGSPTWLLIGLWAIPTATVVGWTLVRPRPAVATDDDDDGWTTYSIQYVLVGEQSPRPAPIRMMSAVLFGAPIFWSLLVFGLSTLVGLF